MEETFKFKIFESLAHFLSNPRAGRLLSSGVVREIGVTSSDPLFNEIGVVHRRLAQQGKTFFSTYTIERRYTSKELDEAELLSLSVRNVFGPAGEECGTLYDDTSACHQCGSGAQQLTPLHLDLRRVPEDKDIVVTFASELLVSEKLKSLLEVASIAGGTFKPVYHSPRWQDDPVDYRRVPSGRALLEAAKGQGIEAGSTKFYKWLNQDEQKGLVSRANQEQVARMQETEQRGGELSGAWHQLLITSNPIRILVPPTVTGVSPYEVDRENEFHCECGINLGQHILSELYVSRPSWDNSDLAATLEVTGRRQGIIRPVGRWLVSQRMRHLLEEENVSGLRFEVVQLR